MHTPRWHIFGAAEDRDEVSHPADSPQIANSSVPPAPAVPAPKSLKSTPAPAPTSLWQRAADKALVRLVENPLLSWKLAVIGGLLFFAFVFWLAGRSETAAAGMNAAPTLDPCVGCIDAVPIADQKPTTTKTPSHTGRTQDTTQAE